MGATRPDKWLLLIHQIPTKPDALRVKTWRRLQQVGAAAVKPSVYVMPVSEQAREDLSWTLKEIVDGGGEGSIAEARFVEGLTDMQVRTLFQSARRADYEKLVQEANGLLAEWASGDVPHEELAAKGPALLARLRRRLADIAAIDFFHAPERATAELLLTELGGLLERPASDGAAPKTRWGDLIGKTWVTRQNLFVDRIACGWLIRRFVDPVAAFRFVAGARHAPKPGEVRFDMFDGEFTHEGDRCTFEVMVRRLRLKDHALGPMAEVVHDIDLKDDKFGRGETGGFHALLTGLAVAQPDDDLRMTEGIRLFEHLYAYFQGQKPE